MQRFLHFDLLNVWIQYRRHRGVLGREITRAKTSHLAALASSTRPDKDAPIIPVFPRLIFSYKAHGLQSAPAISAGNTAICRLYGAIHMPVNNIFDFQKEIEFNALSNTVSVSVLQHLCNMSLL
jgi:hypothetical protein